MELVMNQPVTSLLKEVRNEATGSLWSKKTPSALRFCSTTLPRGRLVGVEECAHLTCGGEHDLRGGW